MAKKPRNEQEQAEELMTQVLKRMPPGTGFRTFSFSRDEGEALILPKFPVVDWVGIVWWCNHNGTGIPGFVLTPADGPADYNYHVTNDPDVLLKAVVWRLKNINGQMKSLLVPVAILKTSPKLLHHAAAQVIEMAASGLVGALEMVRTAVSAGRK